MPSIWQPWAQEIGLRHQGVLIAGVGRGCDIAIRHDPSKVSQRLLRGAVLVPHCGRFANPKTYIWQERDAGKWWAGLVPFMNSWDHYPNHYVVHFVHAAEVIGYCGPDEFPVFSSRWKEFYERACKTLHVNPEMADQLNARLDADEEEFYKNQDVVRGLDKLTQE